jgi:hypothetical protein
MIEPIRTNRTGVATSPMDAPQTAEAALSHPPTSRGDAHAIADLRDAYNRAANEIGSIPPPTSIKGLGQSTLQFLKGNNAPLLLDKLGQRLAFERTGVRLYEAVRVKLDVYGSWEGGPDSTSLQRIHDDEWDHATLLATAIESLGADPTAQTPSADISGVNALGVVQVLSDPRITLAQSLDSVLTIELTDVASWEMLIDMTRSFGLDELTLAFERAHAQEEDHLRQVKAWMRAYNIAASPSFEDLASTEHAKSEAVAGPK